MSVELDKHYDPKAIEPKWYAEWTDKGLFHSDASKGGDPYCVVIPPPNVTGILHMGHALNNTIQDILVRWRRMQGRNVVWLPGTDHAGIATQNVVERALKKEGKTREDLGRDAFIERVWEWRKEYGSTIINQLKKLGSSCDWERERFTMDEGLSDAVSEVFVQLYNKGLIYRGNYIINWCSRCQTALSDEESEHAETNGKLYYIKYPVRGLADHEFLTVATTRPETLLGDVAVAVNPEDERYAGIDEAEVILPIVDRPLKVIRDDFVDPEFGTGIVKVTPAHDSNDFDMGNRHGLEPINVMNGDGTMNENAGPYEGMDRFDCRKKILKDLEKAKLIEKIEDHKNAIGHCYRCDTVVEPRLSPQWFVKMKPLADRALEVVKDGQVEFVPARWTKVYLEWMENIRDWCISRQIWWGHRIPVFYCNDCDAQGAEKGSPSICSKCSSSNIRQDEDVLDTWFSSWLWPFSTFGWPKNSEDLKCYYPTHDLVTASEIIFFWVARMIMAGLEFMDEVPFSKVYIHGTVRDDKGLKMSKSLGNSIDPLDIIEEFSADALRFSLTMLTATGQDVYISSEKFEIGRNFGTKLWNAARFIQMHSEDFDVASAIESPVSDAELLCADDRHILASLSDAIAAYDDNLGRYRFNDAAHVLYDFVWSKFCDWHVEYAKDTLYGDDVERKQQVLRVMHHVFANALKLLHPIMPFVTEELWHAMGYSCAGDYIMCASWPEQFSGEQMKEWGITPQIVTYVDKRHELVRAGRALRADYSIAPSKKVDFVIKPADADAEALLNQDQVTMMSLLRAETIGLDDGYAPDKATPSAVSKLGTVYMPIKGLVDPAAEIERLRTQLNQVEKGLNMVNGKLQNMNFVKKAPKEVVEQQESKKRELLETQEKLERLIATLSSL